MGAVLNYFDELCRAMQMLAANPKTIFLGQGVGCAGTTMTDTLKGISSDQLLEFPVAEDLQMGTAIGMALEGYLPVCIFPRWNFLLLAANQLVNHLDRLPLYSNNGYIPKVIIRVAVPITESFNAGPQHSDDFSEPFRWMLKTIPVRLIPRAENVVPYYQQALASRYSHLMVEYTNLYSRIPSGVPEGVPDAAAEAALAAD